MTLNTFCHRQQYKSEKKQENTTCDYAFIVDKRKKNKQTFSVSVDDECCNVAGLGSELMLT